MYSYTKSAMVHLDGTTIFSEMGMWPRLVALPRPKLPPRMVALQPLAREADQNRLRSRPMCKLSRGMCIILNNIGGGVNDASSQMRVSAIKMQLISKCRSKCRSKCNLHLDLHLDLHLTKQYLGFAEHIDGMRLRHQRHQSKAPCRLLLGGFFGDLFLLCSLFGGLCNLFLSLLLFLLLDIIHYKQFWLGRVPGWMLDAPSWMVQQW
jgi:hypothetical protein